MEKLSHRCILDPPQFPGLLGKIDDYEILRLIGAGGMGLVFLARDSASSALVAVKVIKPELMEDPRAVAYFLKEARHMQRLEHPSIVRVLAVSASPERPYFVMPYIEGGSLGKLIQSGKPLAADLVLAFARPIASALACAHSRGIIHRDIKPANILIEKDRRTYLTDFGLARTLFNDTVVDFQRARGEGTAPYMSPGKARGETEDTRGDIYSFGAVLYEMLTGKPPYSGATHEEVVKQIVASPPPPILRVNPHASPALAQIAERAMARELCGRYAQMQDVVADLDGVAQGVQPGKPGRPSVLARQHSSRRYDRRRSAIIASLCLAAMATTSC